MNGRLIRIEITPCKSVHGLNLVEIWEDGDKRPCFMPRAVAMEVMEALGLAKLNINTQHGVNK